MAILAKLLDMDFKFVSPLIYINFNIQTNFEVNQTQIGHSIPKNTPIKNTKMAKSQNHILPKYHSPKSLLLLHFSINLSETFRININMDFSHTSRDRFLIKISVKNSKKVGLFWFWAKWLIYVVYHYSRAKRASAEVYQAKWGFEIRVRPFNFMSFFGVFLGIEWLFWVWLTSQNWIVYRS